MARPDTSRYAGIMLLTLFALQAAAFATPTQPRLFRDWYVACDNTNRCQAAALMPGEEFDGLETGLLERGPGARDIATFYLTSPETAPASIRIDGRPVAATVAPTEAESDPGLRVVPADPTAFLAAVQRGQWMELLDGAGTRTGRISLAGAAAAMLYMDEAQGRVGPPAPPRPSPVVRLARTSEQPATLSDADLARLRRQSRCPSGDVGSGDVETGALGGGRTLVLLPCGAGAYNFSSVPYVATRAGRALRFVEAPFDIPLDSVEREEGHRYLVNAAWDQGGVTLSDFAKGRGLGDCGSRSRFGWDGARFRLIHREEMRECRGSITYVTTWRAEAR